MNTLERQYLKAAAALDDARRDGELTDDEYAHEHSRLTLAYEVKIDNEAEAIKEYGHEELEWK